MPTKTQMKPFSTRLPDDVRAALQAKAQALGLTESDLGRMFLIEKLSGVESSPAAFVNELRSLAALIIAANSDTIDLDQARELVAQHVTSETAVTP